jgi:hypothetical protein
MAALYGDSASADSRATRRVGRVVAATISASAGILGRLAADPVGPPDGAGGARMFASPLGIRQVPAADNKPPPHRGEDHALVKRPPPG